MSRLEKEQREKAYRIYISDILRADVQRHYKSDIPRYVDIYKVSKNETRTPEEIKKAIYNKLKQMGGKS